MQLSILCIVVANENLYRPTFFTNIKTTGIDEESHLEGKLTEE